MQVLPQIPRGESTFPGGLGAPSTTSVTAKGAYSSLMGEGSDVGANDRADQLQRARRREAAVIGTSLAAAGILLLCATGLLIVRCIRKESACGHKSDGSKHTQVHVSCYCIQALCLSAK